jgi:hypothetical protein
LSEHENQLCPWCQTEIVWDPEIGPEDTCPHCLNEVGDYRSISLKLKNSGQNVIFDEDEDYEEELEAMDEYEEGAQRLLDLQEEAPECPSCHSFMLFTGTQLAPQTYVPYVREGLKQPLLKPSFAMNVFVCPSCFKVEHILAEESRNALIELVKTCGQDTED